MSGVKFLAGDRVRWGDDLGRVSLSWENGNFSVVFDRAPREVVNFKADGSFNLNPRGMNIGPRIQLIERPKQKRKVRLWRWERWAPSTPRTVECLQQTENLYESNPPFDVEKQWTKVPGSEREIEVSTDE